MARTSRKFLGENGNINAQHSELKKWNTGIYLRLSSKHEVYNNDESNSISNQRKILLNYIDNNDYLKLNNIYIDDGKTGTNLNRPGFSNMIEDIKNNNINCVIVKDFSRLGRNFYEMGSIIETLFPLYGVRLISVTDNFDSTKTNQSETSYIVPIKNLMNASYVDDISKKIKSSREMLMKQGKFVGVHAIYGYKKSIECKYQLEIDIDAANVVQMIFDMVEDGKGDYSIAQYLNKENISTPIQYKIKNGLLKSNLRYDSCQYWTKKMIMRITTSQVYTGAVVQGQHYTLTPKGKTIQRPENEWVIVENCHEPIITDKQFKSVQIIRERRKNEYIKKCLNKPYSENIFRGLIYCGDCGQAMTRHRRINKFGETYDYLCSYYESGGVCIKKIINEKKLIDMILITINNQANIFGNTSDKTLRNINYKEKIKANICETKSEMNSLQNKINKTIYYKSCIYNDYKKGILDKESFILLKEKYNNENKANERKINWLKNNDKINPEFTNISLNINRFDKIDNEVLILLVDRIEIFKGTHIHIKFKFDEVFGNHINI